MQAYQTDRPSAEETDAIDSCRADLLNELEALEHTTGELRRMLIARSSADIDLTLAHHVGCRLEAASLRVNARADALADATVDGNVNRDRTALYDDLAAKVLNRETAHMELATPR